MNTHCLQWDGALLECLQLSQLALGTAVPLGDPYLPAAASASACCGTAIPLLWFPLLAVGQRFFCCGFLCLLCVSGSVILRRSLYIATANYDMGYPLYCETHCIVTLLTLKLVLLGGRALQIFYVGGAAPFGGPSYFPPKVTLLVLPLRASNSMSSLVPFTRAHAHALRGWMVLKSC